MNDSMNGALGQFRPSERNYRTPVMALEKLTSADITNLKKAKPTLKKIAFRPIKEWRVDQE